MNPERIELPDIDIDLAPSKKNMILKNIKIERGQNFYSDIDDIPSVTPFMKAEMEYYD